MTEGELIDLDGLDGAWAFYCLMPYMAHPAGGRRRELFEAWLLGKIAAEADEPLCAAQLKALVEAAEVGVGSDLNDATLHGSMAGEVLLTVLWLHENGEPSGLDRAQHVVSEWYRQTPAPNGTRFRAGRDTVRNAWRAYRDAAHLWGAIAVIRRVEGDGAFLDGLKVAGVAAGLHRAANRIPTTNGEPILSPRALRLSVQPYDVSAPDGLSAGVVGALECYRPRNA